MRLRVAIDARTIFAVHRRGTGKNLIDLYRHVAEMFPDWQFALFHQGAAIDDPFASMPNVCHRKIDIRGDRWNLWQDVRLPIAARRWGANVLHSPANEAPLFPLSPSVVTIHDLIPVEIAPGEPSTRRWLLRVGRAARFARRIITPSEYSRQAIIKNLGVPTEKIIVNYWAPDRNCQPATAPGAITAVRKKYAIPCEARYVLAFGAQDPRKNTAGILDAWSRIPQPARADAVLLFVGLQPEALRYYLDQADRRIGDGSYRLHGFAQEEDICPLLSGATVLCYPSRSEGFGLPILDAFACGTPVITSRTTSLPEVAGSAALLVNPDDPAAIAAALIEILSSEDTRSRLREAGSRRLSLFSWEKCARTVAGVLAAAALGPGTNEEY